MDDFSFVFEIRALELMTGERCEESSEPGWLRPRAPYGLGLMSFADYVETPEPEKASLSLFSAISGSVVCLISLVNVCVDLVGSFFDDYKYKLILRLMIFPGYYSNQRFVIYLLSPSAVIFSK